MADNKKMILPTAYLPPRSYIEAMMSKPVMIEQMETFEKQTFRNRCLVKARGERNYSDGAGEESGA